MKRKLITVTLLILAIIMTSGLAHAKTIENKNATTGIPQNVLDTVNKKVQESQYALPEVRAWEIDLQGNKTEVIPRSQRNNISTGAEDNIVYSAPNDGYLYVFDYYDASNNQRNWYFKNNGIFRFTNNTNQPTPVTYTQESTVTTTWNVTGSVSAEYTVGNGFLAGVTAKAGISVGRDKTWYSGRSYGVSQDVPAHTVVYITNYQVGVDTYGTLYWKRYTPSGMTMIGYYTESAGGTVIDEQDLNIEISNTQPIY